MDESRRLAMRRAHAKHADYCTCGKVVSGNGGRYQHREMHKRRGDGHHPITQDAWRLRRLALVLLGIELRPGAPIVARGDALRLTRVRPAVGLPRHAGWWLVSGGEHLPVTCAAVGGTEGSTSKWKALSDAERHYEVLGGAPRGKS